MTSLKAAVRALRKSPGFTTVAVLTLAVGIAANAALFSVYDKLVLHPVSIDEPGSLVALWSVNTQNNFNAPALSWPRYQEIARHARSFSSIAISAFDNFTLTGDSGQPDQLNGLRVSADFLETLGVTPVLGRDFTRVEDVPNGPPVCLLSHELWTSRFGQRPSVIGETIQLNGQSWQVIGVVPPNMTNPFTAVQIYAPRVFEVGGLTPLQVEVGAGYAQPIARLAKGVTPAQADAELAAISRSYHDQFGGKLDASTQTIARDFVDSLVSQLKPTFYTLLGAVGFVLLIACANVASLFLGRLNARRKEIAVRQSLGATRGAIVRQCLVESFVFSAGAAVIGAALASWALSGVQSLVANQLPANATLTLNWRALLLIVGASLVSAFFVGLAPAIQASKTDLVTTLKDAMRGSSAGANGRFRASLIIGEVALSVMLLVGSSLLLVSFLSLERTPPGFEAKGVASAFVGLPATRYSTPEAQAGMFARIMDRLHADPRVTGAAIALGLPINGFGAQAPYSVIGRPILPLPQRPLATLQIVSEDYFDVLHIHISQGRAFTALDRFGAPGVCIINAALAAKLFPGESPLGHQLGRGPNGTTVHTIVGVIDNIKSAGVNAPAPDEVYYPSRQLNRAGMTLIAKTSGDPNALQTIMRQAVAEADPDQPISFFQTLETSLAQSLGVQRIVASLTACYAAIALVLAAIGLYSVVAYAVAQRTSEIGIRMALGANSRQVVALVMSNGLKLVAAGLVIGLAGAAGTSRFIQSLLSNVTPTDPLIYGGVAMFFGAVSALACLVPSLRASRIDPLIALSATDGHRAKR